MFSLLVASVLATAAFGQIIEQFNQAVDRDLDRWQRVPDRAYSFSHIRNEFTTKLGANATVYSHLSSTPKFTKIHATLKRAGDVQVTRETSHLSISFPVTTTPTFHTEAHVTSMGVMRRVWIYGNFTVKLNFILRFVKHELFNVMYVVASANEGGAGGYYGQLEATSGGVDELNHETAAAVGNEFVNGTTTKHDFYLYFQQNYGEIIKQNMNATTDLAKYYV